MIQIGTTINAYSEMNPQIDFIVQLTDDSLLPLASSIIEAAYDRWFTTEDYPETHDIPISEYISDCLTTKQIEHEIYYKAIPCEDE